MQLNLIRQPWIAGFACLALSLTVSAQSTSGSYEPELSSIVMESVVDVNGGNLKTPAPLPATLLGILAAGGQLRSRVDKYDPVARTFRTTLYLSSPAQPMPLPDASLPGPNDLALVSQSTLRVESIYAVKGSPSALAMIGRFVASQGSLSVASGTPFLFSFTYPAEATNAGGSTSATFGESSFLIPGQINIYSPAPVGSVTVTPPPSN